ncbi:hypothetical protein PG984_008449, partial [Apiospora sp. TS-2023a]
PAPRDPRVSGQPYPSSGEARHGGASERACLSYVWGGEQHVRTTKQTLQSHTNEGIIIQTLPKTLVDAIRVCQRLGIPYSWIDALCIIQDDPADIRQELGMMSQIYQQGYLTICASRAGGVHDGFLGQHGYPYETFPPTKVSCVYFSTLGQVKYQAKDRRTAHVLLLEDDASLDRRSLLDRQGNPINFRAWIFQEALLSPRKLSYTLDSMRWYCRATTMIRNSLGNKDKLFADDKYSTKITPEAAIPCIPGRPMPALEEIAEMYSRRAMTNPSDKLAALSAIANIIADGDGYTYLAGLFKEKLPMQLCWMAHEGLPMPRPKQYRAPSWSWTSVDAPIRFSGYWGTPSLPDSMGILIDHSHGRTDETDGVEVLSAHIVPTSPGSEYFSVESGRLELRAVMRTIECEINMRDGTGQVLVNGHFMRCMVDAWEEDWPDRDMILELDGKLAQDASVAAAPGSNDNDGAHAPTADDDDDDQDSITSDSDIFFHNIEAHAVLIKKRHKFDQVIKSQESAWDDYTHGGWESFDRDGILLILEGDHYKRIGSCQWHNLDRQMFDCKAANLPGWEVKTIAVI